MTTTAEDPLDAAPADEAGRPAHPFPMRRPPVRPPVKTHGGKYYLAMAHQAAIRAAFGDQLARTSFDVDACGGGGTRGLNEPGHVATVQVYNDRDPKKFNLFWVLRDAFGEFYEKVLAVPYSLASWQGATERDVAWSPAVGSVAAPQVDRAVDFVVRSRMSRGGLGNAFGASSRLRGGQNEYANAWQTLRERLFLIAGRVSRWVLFNEDAVDVVRRFGPNRDATIYLDPPYLPDSRTAKRAYEHEMDEAAHVRLLAAARQAAARVAICGYHSELYDRELRGWRLFEWHVKNNAGQGRVKQDRTECLWVNSPERGGNEP